MLELVHSTDDDSLLLIMVVDPNSLLVQEISLDDMSDKDVQFIKQRYGMSTESMISNVETMFRTLEF